MHPAASESYHRYETVLGKAADLYNAAAVLGWDQEVYMPVKGAAFRGRQLATLASEAHRISTDPAFGELLRSLSGMQGLTEVQQRNVALSLEDFTKNEKLPAEFVEALARQSSDSFNAWIKARESKNFKDYQEELGKMIALKRRQAELYGYEGHPYDALLDEYEPGATVELLDGIFAQVKESLPKLLAKIRAAQQVNDDFLYRHFPKQDQWDFSIEVLAAMGYDMQAGRQDLSEHPFTTTFAPTDVRITTRVSEDNFASLLWSSIHEGGHALYEQGLPDTQYGKPLGSAASLSIHESQSRLWENCVGRGLGLWRHFFPMLLQRFPNALNGVTDLDFYKGINRVEPSLIRTEADELTYHFHVLIRYEIEKALIEGSLSVEELPAKWNALYEQYLGVTPPDDLQGVLQDVHWSHGSFGYFPTYSLGSFYAVQFFNQAKKEIDGLERNIESGELLELRRWLLHKVHVHGRHYRSEALCNRITGSGLDFSIFMQYLEEKYGGIYGL